jgi:hypothetical protein
MSVLENATAQQKARIFCQANDVRKCDARILSQPSVASSPKQSIQSITTHCGHWPRPPLKPALFVVRPDGPAKLICAKCWQLEHANEFKAAVRVQFDDLFARLRPQLIPAGGALLVMPAEGRAI